MYTFGDECRIGGDPLEITGNGPSASPEKCQQLIDGFFEFENVESSKCAPCLSSRHDAPDALRPEFQTGRNRARRAAFVRSGTRGLGAPSLFL